MANEKRLICANVVLAKQFTTGLSDASGNYYGYADVVFVDDIENSPTVDAVEVVRCKDCIYAELAEDGDLYCDGPIGICGTVGFNDFCSCGERREGE